MIRHTNITKRLVFDMEKIITERDQLREENKDLRATCDLACDANTELRERVRLLEKDLGDACEENNKIFGSSLKQVKELKAQLAKKDEALGSITKILKRGQAYDVAKRALAELKNEE